MQVTVWLRRWAILVHRYLGTALSLLFVTWFVSGIGMIYTGGMPRLTPDLRLERMPTLDFTRIRVSPSDAVKKTGAIGDPQRMVLLTIMDRPAYRIINGGFATVFADNGDLLEDVGEADMMGIASRFARLPLARLHHDAVLGAPDQWTIAERGLMPLHKISANDEAHTEVYVSPELAEVVVQTTRRSRALAWAAAIPHWLYVAPLRRWDLAWRYVVLWTSGLGVILAALGILVGLIQFSPSRPFRLNRLGSYIPYAGWMRWHYITGIVFGTFTLTWVFSGLLSMEPWDWVNRGGSTAAMRAALSGGTLNVSGFPSMDAAAWSHLPQANAIKEVEFLRVQGDPYYLIRGAEPEPLLLTATPLQIKRNGFSIESVVARIQQGKEGAPILESEVLAGYDAYYYERDGRLPLPVLRLKFGDPDNTWVYVDPALSRLAAKFTRQERVERWLYHGLHSLDFPFWYFRRPLWDVGVIALSLGGGLSSAIGLFLGFRRLARYGKQRLVD